MRSIIYVVSIMRVVIGQTFSYAEACTWCSESATKCDMRIEARRYR